MLSEIATWDKNYRRLQHYVATHLSFDMAAHNRLYPWVREQRLSGMHGTMTAERRERLERIGFLFTTEPVALSAQAWELHYAELARLIALDRDYVPSQRGASKGIFGWVAKQNMHIRTGELSVPRTALLRALSPRLFRTRRATQKH